MLPTAIHQHPSIPLSSPLYHREVLTPSSLSVQDVRSLFKSLTSPRVRWKSVEQKSYHDEKNTAAE